MPLAFWNNAFTLLSSVSLPRQESAPPSFYVKHAGKRRGWEGGRAGARPSPVSGDPSLYLQSSRTSGRSFI